jgi:hypothetical protein
MPTIKFTNTIIKHHLEITHAPTKVELYTNESLNIKTSDTIHVNNFVLIKHMIFSILVGHLAVH